MFYVKNHLHCTQLSWSLENELECIGLKITLSPQMSFTIIGMYRPPNTKNTFYDQLHTILTECDLDKETILMGDFNINWENKRARKNLKQTLTKFEFVQLVKGPTRLTPTSKTQIDLVFTNRPERITKSFNFITGLSDHNLTLISRKLSRNRFNLSSTKKPSYFRIPKADQDNFDTAIKEIKWCDLLSGMDVETDSQQFLSKIKSTINSFLKETKPKHRQKSILPWVNEEIRKLMKERDRALKTALKSKTEHDKRRFTTLRNKVTKELRQAKASLFINIINEAKGNCKLIWENIKKLTGKDNGNSGKRLELNINGCLTQDSLQVATAFNRYFVDSVKATCSAS